MVLGSNPSGITGKASEKSGAFMFKGVNPKCCGARIKNLALRFLSTYLYDLRYCILTETILLDDILDHFEFKGVIVDDETFDIELQ